jgi:hypothetical protein
LLTVLQRRRGGTGAHERRQPELAADDCGMRRPAAVIRDDGRRELHDGHPIRVGDRRDEHAARHEPRDLRRALEHANGTYRDGLADGGAGQEPRAGAFQLVRFDLPGGAPRLHRLGSGLQHIELTRRPVLGPLHVHRLAVVTLDRNRPARERQHLVVAEDELGALPGARPLQPRRRGLGVDELAFFVAELALDDRLQLSPFEQRLEHAVLVRIDAALHDRLA